MVKRKPLLIQLKKGSPRFLSSAAKVVEVPNDKSKAVKANIDSINNVYKPSAKKKLTNDVIVEVMEPSKDQNEDESLEEGGLQKGSLFI